MNHGDTLTTDLVESARKQLAEARTDSLTRPTRFLDAWKRGVVLAGVGYFHVSAPSIDAATDKSQLRPKNLDTIESAIEVISTGEAVFLCAMYSFYNSLDGERLLQRLGYPNICDIAAALDYEHARIIADLFTSYCGW